MPTLSQCVDDEPLTWWSSSSWVGRQPDLNVEQVYSESHRLAVEELVAGGVDAYYEFLKKERVRNFLSDDEIKFILQAAEAHKSAPQPGDSGSYVLHDATSLVYFPNVSDIEAPTLDIGWPVFPSGKVRGPTTAIAHFHPNYAPYTPVDHIYSCKDAARRMIKSAKEAIAIVTDSFTDVDIFRDLQEACTQRRVPVYILLDREAVPAFLQMCSNLSVRLADLQKMRVRAVAGFRYFTRFGACITGRIHEQFMLVDGNKVAMGTYRFRWTDGRINTCNLIELTGEVTAQYEEEFQRLYKKSLALNTKATLPPQGPRASPLSLTSPGIKPSRSQALGVLLTSVCPAAATPAAPPPPNPPVARPVLRTTSTQTFSQCLTQDTQTDPMPNPPQQPRVCLNSVSSDSDSNCSTPTETVPQPQTKGLLSAKPGPTPMTSYTFRLSEQSVSKESKQQPQRQQKQNYLPSSNLGKLDHTTSSLATKTELTDWSRLSMRSGFLHRGCKVQQSIRPGPGFTMSSMLMVTPMRSRFLQ
ncbi:hypothetical protein ACEWY4_013578 [Coilia grayii]|uniref:Scaffolding anchor of CK1 domain-containing protein n=1 Tax=Coilia grayii TaxID=363190 RepID=A0ABD1JWQ5_9TELE